MILPILSMIYIIVALGLYIGLDMSNETYRNGFMVFISVTWFVTIPIGIISVLVSESINDNYEARNKCDKCGKDGLRIDKKV